MRKSLFVATFVACLSLLTFSVSSGLAQVGGRPPAAPTPQRATVVVLDVGAVFKQHNRFIQQMELMKKDVANFENYVRGERDKIVKLTENLKDFNPGTPNFRNLEKQSAQLQSDLAVEMQLKKRDFMEREARLYYNIYTEVKGAVTRFANEWGISLVLRYNSESIDPSDRASVLAGVNSPIVFQRSLDITEHIVRILNEGTPPPEARDDLSRRPQLPAAGPPR